MTYNHIWMGNVRPNCTQIRLADGSVVYSEGMGSVRFNPVINGQEMPPLEFSEVLYVPALSSNIFSLLYLTMHRHFTVFIEKDTMNFIKNGKTLFQAMTGASNAAFVVGDHSCGRICLTIIYHHSPIELGPLASSPLPPPPLWHQEALCR